MAAVVQKHNVEIQTHRLKENTAVFSLLLCPFESLWKCRQDEHTSSEKQQ